MSSGQDYANRIREQAQKALSPQIGMLKEELRALPGTLSASIQMLEQNIEAIRQLEIPMTEVIIGEAVDEITRQRDTERVSLAHYAHDIRAKETQEEILTLLLEEAGRFAPLAALFVVRDEKLVGWSCHAYSTGFAEKISGFSIGQTESAFLQRALVSDGLTSSADLSGEPSLGRLFHDEASGPWHAFPMKALQRPVAILVAAAAGSRRCDLESLCLVMDITGVCIENLALRILQDLRVPAEPAQEPVFVRPEPAPPRAAQAEVTDQSVEAAPPVAVESPAEPLAAPSAEPLAAVAFAEASPLDTIDQVPEPRQEEPPVPAIESPSECVPAHAEEAAVPAEEPAGTETRIEEQPTVAAEAAAEPAAPAPALPSVVTPFPVQRASTALESYPAPEPPRTSQSDEQVTYSIGFSAPTEAQRLSEEEKLHADAKKFARLLASEIKLYNEQRVMEGRENRDIYVRLKRDIDRSRDTYQKRVAPSVARKIDYFHDEIVRILGDNDPSTLGSDYPGPLVES